MPPLSHWPHKPEPFDPARSEVLAWLAAQPPLLAWLMGRLSERGLIAYDEASGCWQGVPVPEGQPDEPDRTEGLAKVEAPHKTPGRPAKVTPEMVASFAKELETAGGLRKVASISELLNYLAERWGVCRRTAERHLGHLVKAASAKAAPDHQPAGSRSAWFAAMKKRPPADSACPPTAGGCITPQDETYAGSDAVS